MTLSAIADGSVAARVLAIDVDELTLGRVKAAVRGTEFTASEVSREQVLERIGSLGDRVIVLLEWVEDGSDERVQLCQALRRVAASNRCYIVALGGPADHAALLRAASGTVDDVLSRPFGSDLMLVRLRQAVRTMKMAVLPSTPRGALDEALLYGSGEVCVRSGEVVARIHVQDGHIVWANLSSAPATIEDVVRHAGVSLDADLSAAVKQECRSTGAHFMDVLVQWGALPQDRAREAARSFVAERVELILDLPDSVALFLPRKKPQTHSEQLRFRASEIPSLRIPTAVSTDSFFSEPPLPESRRTPALPLLALADIVEAAMQMEGAIGAAILERGTGACLFHGGLDLDTEVAWSQVSALAALGPGAEDVLASAGAHIFVTRPLRHTPSLALFVAASAERTTLGLARSTIAAIVAGTGGPRPAVRVRMPEKAPE